MTKPNPTQIMLDALKLIISDGGVEYDNDGLSRDDMIKVARKALAAAAEVGYDPELDDITIRMQLERIKTLEGEITERDEIIAGLRHHVQRLTKLLDDQLGTPCEQIRHAQEIVATIERCAQVAEAIEVWDTECVKLKAAIIAAIRALKDKP